MAYINTLDFAYLKVSELCETLAWIKKYLVRRELFRQFEDLLYPPLHTLIVMPLTLASANPLPICVNFPQQHTPPVSGFYLGIAL